MIPGSGRKGRLRHNHEARIPIWFWRGCSSFLRTMPFMPPLRFTEGHQVSLLNLDSANACPAPARYRACGGICLSFRTLARFPIKIQSICLFMGRGGRPLGIAFAAGVTCGITFPQNSTHPVPAASPHTPAGCGAARNIFPGRGGCARSSIFPGSGGGNRGRPDARSCR